MPKRSVRDQWKAKLEGKGLNVSHKETRLGIQKRGFRGIILGIDPSLRSTGIAIIETNSLQRINFLYSDTIKNPTPLCTADCLAAIARRISEVIERFPVAHVAIEETIYVQNFRIAQILGAARGAAIAAAGLGGLPVYEYPPLRIKQAVVGFGRASKEQLASTVCSLLKQSHPLPTDEADAVGTALCHAFTFVDA